MLRIDFVIIHRETQKKTGVSNLIKSTLLPFRNYKKINSKSDIPVKNSLISLKNIVENVFHFPVRYLTDEFLLVTG